MKDRLRVKKVALSLLIIFAVIYLICAIVIAIAPKSLEIFGYLFHGIDISKIATTPTIIGTLIGLIEISVLGFIIGWLFAEVYNRIK